VWVWGEREGSKKVQTRLTALVQRRFNEVQGFKKVQGFKREKLKTES
jgi:hypothetical protein